MRVFSGFRALRLRGPMIAGGLGLCLVLTAAYPRLQIRYKSSRGPIQDHR